MTQEIIKGELLECCDNPKTRQVRYDGDNNTYLVCDDHWLDECFHRFAIFIKEVKQNA